jgi:diguanylate cyclase
MPKDQNDIPIKTIGRLSLQALTWLRDQQIPALPVPYSVAFEYHHNVIDKLVARVDELKAEGLFDLDTLDQLFREFILTKYIDFDGFNKTVIEIVDDTGSAVTEARDQLKQFRDFLIEAQKRLDELTDNKTKELVETIIQNTSTTAESVLSLEKHLNSVMAEMRVLQKKYNRMQQQAQQDQLTGLLNRNALQTKFKQQIENENMDSLALAVADIDHFKKFNDTHGHTVGDKVIKLVADTLVSNLKGSDIVSRYGGEEFVILLPNTKATDALNLMNKIRQIIAKLSFINKVTGQKVGGITMSFGITQLKEGDNFHSLFDRADKALYRSKHNGRNCVNCEY